MTENIFIFVRIFAFILSVAPCSCLPLSWTPQRAPHVSSSHNCFLLQGGVIDGCVRLGGKQINFPPSYPFLSSLSSSPPPRSLPFFLFLLSLCNSQSLIFCLLFPWTKRNKTSLCVCSQCAQSILAPVRPPCLLFFFSAFSFTGFLPAARTLGFLSILFIPRLKKLSDVKNWQDLNSCFSLTNVSLLHVKRSAFFFSPLAVFLHLFFFWKWSGLFCSGSKSISHGGPLKPKILRLDLPELPRQFVCNRKHWSMKKKISWC